MRLLLGELANSMAALKSVFKNLKTFCFIVEKENEKNNI